MSDSFEDLPVAPDGEAFDPALELALLLQKNAEKMNELAKQGVTVADTHTLATAITQNELLEEILREVGGEGAVTRVMLRVHGRLAQLLDGAQSQVSKARLAAPAMPTAPNRFTRRHG